MSFERTSGRTRTLRFRLMIWNAAAVILTGAAVLIAVRTGVRNTLISEVDEVLREDLQEIIIRLKSDRLTSKGSIDWDNLHKELEHKADGHSAHGWFVQFLDASGEVQWASKSAPDDLLFDPKDERNATSKGSLFRYVVGNRPVPDSQVSSVRVGCTQSFIAQDLRRIDELVVLVGAVVFFIAPVGGYILAGRATAPLSQMIITTSRLHPEKLNERLEIRGAKDELDSLAGTINDLLDRLATYLRQRHDFLANAAHELRSPLAAIRSSVEVALAEQRSAQEYEELLPVVMDQCQSLEYLVNQLLLLAEVEGDQLKAYSDRLSLDELLKTSVEMFQAVAEARGINLHLTTNAVTAIAGNRHHLRQVINNILDNAIKFTAERYEAEGATTGDVEIKLVHDDAKGIAILSVKDNGIGIAPEHLPPLFDRFFRVDKARSRGATGGTGLGLNICQTIVNAHRGRIEVESKLHQGTTMRVILPLAPAIEG